MTTYWDRIWGEGIPEARSWFQGDPSPSLELVKAVAPPPAPGILDVGGGVSRLPDALLEAGYRRVGVLDISSRALEEARRRLGARADAVEWIEGDVTEVRHADPWEVWHDRAVLHFLTDPADLAAYRARLLEGLSPRGSVILATFGPDGPERCSGLPCVRYDIATMTGFLGRPFELVEHLLHDHRTPDGKAQQFLYGVFRRTLSETA